MTPELITAIIAIVTPLVVLGATEIVKLILPKLAGWGIVAIVVPALGLLVTFVTNLVTSAGPVWYAQLGLSLLAVFVNELFKQLGKAGTPSA